MRRCVREIYGDVLRLLAFRKERTVVDERFPPIIAIGRKYNVDTPLQARMVDITHEMEQEEQLIAIGNLDELTAIDIDELVEARYQKYRDIGRVIDDRP